MYVYVCIYIYIYVCIQVYIYIYIYIYTCARNCVTCLAPQNKMLPYPQVICLLSPTTACQRTPLRAHLCGGRIPWSSSAKGRHDGNSAFAAKLELIEHDYVP